ncbi:MAG: aldehyde dehydrogenase family protein [Alphaproteobacteria bacterium]|nr:aldehyde dehydrogenase family protein [Alphaproteobacteria bacterium]
MNAMVDLHSGGAKARMQAVLEAQRAAHLREGAPDAAKRKDRLNRCISILQTHSEELVEAMNADFGNRSKEMSRLTDIAGAIGPLKHARDNLDKWMRPEKRKVEAPLNLFGAKAEVQFQPKGVIGIISPWNFPVQLTFGPLAGVLAAGNRAMIKPSEFTPETSTVMARIFDLVFDEEEIAVIEGGSDVGAAFAGLAFDHLVFTGGTSIAYHVMRAAADNLVPLTLELGGKSPVIVSRSADIKKTAARVMTGKTMNAGQICLAPDYTFLPRESRDGFVQAANEAVAKMFPTIKDNPDYTAIVNQRHYDRIKGLVEDARAKGAQVIEINPNNEDFSQQEHRRIPPTLILDPTDDMKVMQEEIFGPVMPIKTYSDVSEAVNYVNANPRPLGLYMFSEDEAETQTVLERTTSGGVTVNDVIFHVSVEDLPFGGVGPAGMGAYHGKDGFLEFSHKKAVYKQMKADLLAMMRPPYSDTFRKQVAARMKA